MSKQIGGSLAGQRVLIVEDEFLVAAMLEDVILDAGANVVGPATSLAEGLRLAALGGFDLAVIDWNLAGERSGPIARALLAQGVPFIVSTGYGQLDAEFAAVPVVIKPYDPDHLEAKLAGLLNAAQDLA